MAEVPYPNDFDRLRANIREELSAQRAMGDLPLDQIVIDRLADGIASNIEYAFDVHWAPKWAKNDEPHRWTEAVEGRDQYFVECLRCRKVWVFPSVAEADSRWEQHLGEAHA